MTPFTYQDAQNLIMLVQSAPLQNLRVASEVANLLQRFQGHIMQAMAPPPGNGLDADAPALAPEPQP